MLTHCKACIFKAHRLLKVQTLCIFPCFALMSQSKGNFFTCSPFSRETIIPMFKHLCVLLQFTPALVFIGIQAMIPTTLVDV